MSKTKYTSTWKIFIAKKSGEGSYDTLAEAYRTSTKTLRRWVFQYQQHGEAGFYSKRGDQHDSKKFKKQCLGSYLCGEGNLE